MLKKMLGPAKLLAVSGMCLLLGCVSYALEKADFLPEKMLNWEFRALEDPVNMALVLIVAGMIGIFSTIIWGLKRGVVDD